MIEYCKGHYNTVGVPVTDPLRLPDSLDMPLRVLEVLSEPVPDGLGLAATLCRLCVPESDCVGVPDPLGVPAARKVTLGIGLGVAPPDGVPVSEPVCCKGLPVRLCVCACERGAAPA